MLFTVAGSVAMPAQMISLEEAGLEQRADLQEWVLSNPAILGPAVKVVTFEFDGLPTAGGAARDRVSVLGLGADGRLVVAELKSSRSADTEVSAIKYAAAGQPHAARVAGRALRPLPVPPPDPHQPGRGAGRAAGPCPRPLARVAAPPPHRPAGPGLLGRRQRQRGLAQRNGPRHRAGPDQRLPLLRLRAAGQQQRADDLGQPDLPGARGGGVHHQPGAPAGQGDGRVQAAGAGRRAGAATRHDRVRGRRHDLHPEPAHRPQLRHAEPARGVARHGPRPAHGALAEQRQRAARLGRRQGGLHAGRADPPHCRAGHRRHRATTSARSGGATRPAGT